MTIFLKEFIVNKNAEIHNISNTFLVLKIWAVTYNLKVNTQFWHNKKDKKYHNIIIVFCTSSSNYCLKRSIIVL